VRWDSVIEQVGDPSTGDCGLSSAWWSIHDDPGPRRRLDDGVLCGVLHDRTPFLRLIRDVAVWGSLECLLNSPRQSKSLSARAHPEFGAERFEAPAICRVVIEKLLELRGGVAE
jgi:hypothetical protein